MKQPTGIELIAAERQRQIEKEGWTPAHDDEHVDGSLGLAAANAKIEQLNLAFDDQSNELETAVQVLEEIHPDCAMEFRYRQYPTLHKRPDGFAMPTLICPEMGGATYEALWHEANASYYALNAEIGDLRAQLTASRAEAARMTEAVKIYGCHTIHCSPVICDCGLAPILGSSTS